MATPDGIAGLVLRDATPGDAAAIRAVHRAAFGGDDEAVLVDRLHADGDVLVSVVAALDGTVVGHILCSDLQMDAGATRVRAAALAPLAVLPDDQRRGIGAALVRRGLDRCRGRGIAVVVVLGHPSYYTRFGFSAAAASAFEAPFSGDAFMALSLTPQTTLPLRATVRYARAFGV